MSIAGGVDKTFESEYDSEKRIFVATKKKILIENLEEEVSKLTVG